MGTAPPANPIAFGVSPLVLLVEDDADSRDLYVVLFERAGWRTAVARDGDEARRAAQALGPDVVLLDLRLPKIDGWSLARRLKADPRTRHIPILAVSGDARPVAREEALAGGAEAFLLKPFMPGDLLRLASTLERGMWRRR